MGIVRLAKSLQLLKSIIEIDNRRSDIGRKIPGTRVYTDFVSIVYKVQLDVAKQINYVIYSLLLLSQGMLHKSTHKKLFKYLELYHDIFSRFTEQKIKNVIDKKSKLNINDVINLRIDENKVIQHVYNHVTGFIGDMCGRKVSDVKYVLIAFDGIPSYGKVQEQRQRRYMRKVQMEFQKAILSRSKPSKKSIKNGKVHGKNNSMKVLHIRQIFDSIRVSINIRKAISTVYSSYENGSLREDIERSIKEITKKKEKIEVVVVEEKYGEGEKILVDMLVDDIKKYGNKEKYVFYSPDGDSVILCLDAYVKAKTKYLNVIKMYELEPLRQHNHKSQYVNIVTLYDNLSSLVSRYGNINDIDGDKIAIDYVILMNLFGNDFIHQHPSTEIGSTVMDIMYIYSQFVRDHGYLHKNNKSDILFNTENLIEFFRVLSENEHKLMLDTMMNNSTNIRQITKTFGNIFAHYKLMKYNDIVRPLKREMLKNISKLNTDNVRGSIDDVVNMLKILLSEVGNEKINVIKDKDSSIGCDEIFMKLEVRGGLREYAKYIIENPKTLLREYGVKPRPNKNESELSNVILRIESSIYKENAPIRFIDKRYRKYEFEYMTILDMFNAHPQMPTTAEDIDMYLLEWRGGDWKNVLNSYSFYDGVDPKDLYENVDIEDMYNEKVLEDDIDTIVESYLKTFSWLKDYYCNSNIIRNPEVISSWSYLYEKSPMFSSIVRYIDSKSISEFDDVIDTVYDDSLVMTTEYMDDTKHKLYIYPMEYDSKGNPEYDVPYPRAFPNVVQYVKHVVTKLEDVRNDKNNDNDNNDNMYFNCGDVPYFSKCVFDNRMLSYDELMEIEL